MDETLRFLLQPALPSEPDPAEEDDEEVGKWCHYCDELIPLVEQAVQIEVMYGLTDGSSFQCYVSYDDEGDFKYTPLHMHEECWEKLMEDIRTINGDVPPSVHTDEAIQCFICESSIRQGEEFSVIKHGEIHVSPREPEDGRVEMDFFEYGKPIPVCFGCMSIADQLLEDEDDDEEDE